jgi:glycosyltransferase involved in cell wall biosynthesis
LSDTVSIVIPAWNAEKTLSDAIESVLVQKSIMDIVVIDDGSTDTTASIASNYVPRVKLQCTANAGVSAARNLGVAKTQGEWIIFLDADDLLTPGTVEKRLEVARSSAADVIISDWQDFTHTPPEALQPLEKHSIDWVALQRDAEIACATHVWATPGAIMYRRSIVDRIAGFREDLPVIQDARFLFDAAYHGAKFAPADHCGALYRITQDSLSRRNRAQFHADILRNGKQIEQLWRNRAELSSQQIQAIAGIYNTAVRGLLASADARYFDAVAAQRSCDAPLPGHTRIFHPIARVLGINNARRLATLISK